MKTPSEELKSFKQYNKVAREVRAKKLGFSSAADYISHLEGQINAGKTTFTTNTSKTSTTSKTTTRAKKVLPIIHVADVLDSSGSMQGGKHTNAKAGINKGLKSLREDKEPVEYTYTLCDFSEDILMPYVCTKLIGVNTVNSHTRGSTALFDAIGSTIQAISEHKKPSDKVLVNIYTDGQENASKRYTQDQIAKSIKELSSQGWTFTFIGTSIDVSYVKRHLHIDSSNTLEYDGTAKGLSMTLSATTVARSAYSKNVAEGKDVSKGFYKNITKK